MIVSDQNYTYILECSDGSLYCGWTNDLKKRLITHNSGKGGKYTRSRLPVRLVYYEIHPTREEAMQREWAIKHLSRKEKLELIKGFPISPDTPTAVRTEYEQTHCPYQG